MSNSLESSFLPVELVVITVASIVFFFYVLHPILADVAPILTFSSGTGELHRRGGLGPVSLAATAVIGVVSYVITRYAIIYMVNNSIKSFFVNTVLMVLVFIPDKYIPEKHRLKNIDLAETEEHDE